ncbi:MAG: DUF2892 domain-containing protein [Gemmatimonadales bacterium]
MERNAGKLDRGLRLVAGIMLLGLYGALEPPLKYFTLFGLVLVGTALTGVCPLYSLFGINTCKPSSRT